MATKIRIAFHFGKKNIVNGGIAPYMVKALSDQEKEFFRHSVISNFCI